MRIISIFLLFSIGLFVFVAERSFAADGVAPQKDFGDHLQTAGKYIFGPPNTDPTWPHLHDAKIPHNSQWDNDSWSPEDWVEAEGNVRNVIDGFYDSGIIVDQYEDEVPVLEVGSRFLELSPRDQRRVVEFVDYAFKITESKPHGVFYIVAEGSRSKLLGLYTSHGLQLQ